MKVLVLGATGFIGFAVSQALVRSGHEVYGQTRSAEKTNLLASEEIIPVVADPTKGEEWSKVVEKVDVVIDCIGGMEVMRISKYVFDVVLEAAKKTRGTSAPRLTFIYCSGTLVHGDDRKNLTSEYATPRNTTALVSWKPDHERRITDASDAGKINGIIVRPSFVYGRSGSMFGMLFGAAQAVAQKGVPLEWPGRKGQRWATIHVDDLADLFVRIAEAGPAVKGLIFDGANPQTEPLDAILEATAHVAGVKEGWTYREPKNVMEETLAVTTILRPGLARTLLGWNPRKPGVLDGIETYFAAAVANSK